METVDADGTRGINREDYMELNGNRLARKLYKYILVWVCLNG